MKLTNNRLYLDYNATSPLCESVLNWLSSGDLPFGNPSSIHTSGKKSKKLINEARDFLFREFSLLEHKLFFHSGASEAINTIVKGIAFDSLRKKETLDFYYLKTDHSCVWQQTDELELLGVNVVPVDVDENGEFDLEALVNKMNSSNSQHKLMNFTWVNNETGVVLPLSLALRIKERTGAIVHVDAVQAPGKIKDFFKLDSKLDFYTFSGHKFGAQKGIGFTFSKSDSSFSAFVKGGGQQEGLRSGTENVHGIYSLKLALEELKEKFDYDELLKFRSSVEKSLLDLSDKIKVQGLNASHRNANTIYITVEGIKADIVLTAFDMAKIDISSGSACSSGIITPSHVLKAMGINDEVSKTALRLSFSPYSAEKDALELSSKVGSVLKRFL